MAQEITTYPNGLIYSPQAMKHINYVVDSLNLKFKKCEFNRKLITDLRGKGTYMRFELVDSTTLLLIESDLNKLLDTSLIINRYRKYIKRLENQAKFSFSYSPKLNQKPSYKIDVQVSSAQNKSIRRMSYSSENIPQRSLRSYFLNRQKVYGIKESTCILHIIWIDTIFPPRYLSNKYIHLVNFVDCMIDTTAKIFGRSGDLSKTKASGFLYKLYYDAIKATICPKISDFEQCIEQIRNDQKLLHKLDKRLKNDTTFLRSLRQAVIHSPYDDEYGSLELPDSNLNWLVERYAPLIMLDYIRQGAVVGECSHDDSPRIQAQKIAYLSAEPTTGVSFCAPTSIL